MGPVVATLDHARCWLAAGPHAGASRCELWLSGPEGLEGPHIALGQQGRDPYPEGTLGEGLPPAELAGAKEGCEMSGKSPASPPCPQGFPGLVSSVPAAWENPCPGLCSQRRSGLELRSPILTEEGTGSGAQLSFLCRGSRPPTGTFRFLFLSGRAQ